MSATCEAKQSKARSRLRERRAAQDRRSRPRVRAAADAPADLHRPPPKEVARRCAISQRGFSLIEVLVAFVILSLVATALFRLFSGALGNAAAASDWSRAMLVAETQLTVAANVQPLREASDQGNDADGRIRWQTKVAPYDPPSTPDDIARASETMPTRLYRVSVDVRFPNDKGGERTISLSTLKLAQRNPP